MIGRWLHVNDVSDPLAWQTLAQVRGILGYVPGVKVVNPDAATLAKLRSEYGARMLIARLNMPGLTLDQGGGGWWDATAGTVASLAAHLDYIEVPVNEQYPDAGEIERYADASAEYVRLAAGVGARCIVGNFSVGTPEVADFVRFLPALEAAHEHGGALGLHEYALPRNFGAGYWLGRWTEFYTAAAVYAEEVWELPCILTEFGIDGGLEKPSRPRDTAGWRAYGMTAAEYVTWLDGALAIEQERADDCGLTLLGVCLFNAGDYSDKAWHSFEIGGEPALTRWLALETAPPANGGNVANANPHGYVAGSGMVAKAEALGWTILSDEIYHDPKQAGSQRSAFSECFCDKGRLYYHADTGTVAVPFA